MTPCLSLHHLTAMDATPAELIRIAGELECQHVCLFTHVPLAVRDRYPIVEEEHVGALRRVMSASGVSLFNCEVFPLGDGMTHELFRSPLAVAAALGGMQATVHVHTGERSRAVDELGRFCELAEAADLRVGLEYNPFSSVTSPSGAASLVDEVNRANLSIVVDALHTMRCGEDPGALSAIGRWVGYGQLCDGPLNIGQAERWREAIAERAAPGDGAFPLREIIASLPRAMVWDVEVPQKRARLAGVTAFDRARHAVEGARRVLGSALNS